MADQSYTDYLNMFAKANVPMKKHTKGVQLLALKYKILHKTFGPFMDLWLKMQQGVQTFGEALESIAKPVEETAEGIDKLTKATGATVLNFRSLILSITIIIGIIMAFVGIVFLLAGSFANMDSVMPGTTDMVEGLKNSFMTLVEAGKGVIDTIMGLDFSPILGPLGMLIGGVVQFMALVIQVYAIIAVGYMEIFTMMGEGGQLQAIIDAVGGIFDSLIWGFGFIMAQLESVGVTGGSTLSTIQSFVDTFVAFLFESGIIDFVVELFSFVAELTGFIIKISAVIIGLLIRYLAWFYSKTEDYWKALSKAIGIIITVVVGALRIIMAYWRGVVALFSGDFDGAIAHFESIIGIADGVFSKVQSLWKGMMDNLKAFFKPLYDMIMKVVDYKDAFSGLFDFGNMGIGGLQFADGGIASGPTSGYPATLHGTEAVVPLPNGRSIPVEMKGAMQQSKGGDNITVNINVSGGGNAKDIAKQVSQEVARTFRNRSRQSGFGRGI